MTEPSRTLQERLHNYVSACKLTGNGGSVHAADVNEAAQLLAEAREALEQFNAAIEDDEARGDDLLWTTAFLKARDKGRAVLAKLKATERE